MIPFVRSGFGVCLYRAVFCEAQGCPRQAIKQETDVATLRRIQPFT